MAKPNEITYKQLQELRRRKLIKAMRRIPSDEERQRKVGSKGFDDSFIDDDALKRIESHHTCFWCKKPIKTDASTVAKKGYIETYCETDGCPGNPNTTKVELPPHMMKRYGRLVDGKLCFDLAKLMMGRDISRLWANQKRMIG